MATTDEALALAEQYRGRGDLQLAEQLCCQILQADPHNPDAHYELGMIAYQVGRPDQAAEHLGRAVSLRPSAAAFHCHLGLAYSALGRIEEAVACNQQALRLQPDNAEAHNNLGIAYRAMGRLGEATTCYEQAVRYQPDFAGTHNNLGAAYQAGGRLDEALGCFREALRLQPRFAAAHVNMGVALLAQAKPDEAIASLREGLRLLPNYAAAHLNLGLALQATGKREEALACFEQAVRLTPRFAEAHLAIASARLLAGDFERGWPEYELRLRCPQFTVPRLPSSHPAWDGSPLEGRTILVRAEQGLGDTIQFIRYARCLQHLGGRVIAEVQPQLLPLLQSCPGIDRLIGQGETLPPFDVHAFLLSLPRLFGTNLTNVPADVPYVAADPALVAHWRNELSAIDGFKIGIAWQGNPTVKLDFLRSFPLTEFAPLAAVEGVHLISLQKGAGSEQLRGLADRFAVLDLGSRLDETSGAFMDTAAVLMNLDLIVTVDTALAHLAGALGVPVWVALGTNPDWRWFLARADSPWYPTMRLVRQQQPCRWSEVFEGIAGAVRKLVAERL
jgi:tetratricopeptide (TPR) repeat protein